MVANPRRRPDGSRAAKSAACGASVAPRAARGSDGGSDRTLARPLRRRLAGSSGRHGCASAGGSRGSWPGGGCSAGKVRLHTGLQVLARGRRSRRPRAVAAVWALPTGQRWRTTAASRPRRYTTAHRTGTRTAGQTGDGPGRDLEGRLLARLPRTHRTRHAGPSTNSPELVLTAAPLAATTARTSDGQGTSPGRPLGSTAAVPRGVAAPPVHSVVHSLWTTGGSWP